MAAAMALITESSTDFAAVVIWSSLTVVYRYSSASKTSTSRDHDGRDCVPIDATCAAIIITAGIAWLILIDRMAHPHRCSLLRLDLRRCGDWGAAISFGRERKRDAITHFVCAAAIIILGWRGAAASFFINAENLFCCDAPFHFGR
jgi:hypothetical protein